MSQVTPYPLTRKDFSEFLPNQRSVRAFEEIFRIVDLIENPVVVDVNSDLDASTEQYVYIAQTDGLTITLPKCSSSIIGRVWSFTLGIAGSLTIETQGGDTFPTVGSPTETSEVISDRGTTVSFRCVSNTNWVIT